MPDHREQDHSGNGHPAVPPMFRLQGAAAPQAPLQAQSQFQPARLPVLRPTRQPDRYAQPQQYWQQQYPVPQQHPVPQHGARKRSLTAAEQFWYVLMNIGFGAGYFMKIPAKRALDLPAVVIPRR